VVGEMTPLEIETVGEAAFVQCFHGVDSTRNTSPPPSPPPSPPKTWRLSWGDENGIRHLIVS